MAKDRIDLLAQEISTMVSEKNTPEWNDKFNLLFTLVSPLFDGYYTQYRNINNLRINQFDAEDYRSSFNMAVYDSVVHFDAKKGGYLSRLWHFSYKQFTAVTVRNFAKKRYNPDLIYIDKYSLDIPTEYKFNADGKTMYEVVDEFIKNDKDGEVISILLNAQDRNDRSKLLTDYYGYYGVRERKRVQRVRERLMKKIKEVL